MLFLNKEALNSLLDQKGLSLSALARQSGISRQSLYNMFDDDTVFNVPFERILKALNVNYQTITYEKTLAEKLLEDAPSPIQKVLFSLIDFCQQHKASLALFGSRARGKKGVRVDWDFGIHFSPPKAPARPRSQIRKAGGDQPLAGAGMTDCTTTENCRALNVLKGLLKEEAFPYRVDIVNLNQAPNWFRKTVDKEYVLLYGEPL